MKTACTFFLLAVSALPAAGQTGGKGERKLNPAESGIRRLEAELAEAVAKGDDVSVEQKLTDEFIFTGPDGTAGNKTQFLKGVRAGGPARVQAVSPEDARIKLYGRTAVVTGRIAVGGEGLDRRMRYTAALVKKGERWQVAALHLTPVAEFVP